MLRPDDRTDDTASFPEAERPVPPAGEAAPPAGDADWVRFESGEWLRGEITRLRDGEAEFDSDQLDAQTFDLDDVEELRTGAPQVVVTEEGAVLRGAVALVGDDLWIEGVRTVRVPREALFALFPLTGGRAVDWSGKLSLGAVLRSGNTDQTDYNARGELVRESARTQWESDYQGTFSRTGEVETASNHRLSSIYDLFLSPRLFLFVPRVELFRDRFQNLDLRATVAAGLGYELVETADHDWRALAGPALQYVRPDEPAVGADDDETNEGVFASTEYSWSVTDAVDLDLEYSITAELPETREFDSHFEARLSVDLLGDLTLDVAFVWDRVNRPDRDEDGDVPRADDYRTTVGLGWTF